MATFPSLMNNTRSLDLLSGSPRVYLVDRWVYVFTAAFFIAINFAGFIPDSLEQVAAVGAGSRHPFPLIMHVHAVLMGLYLSLLLTQTWLGATGRYNWHMRLGVFVAALVPVLVIVGIILARTIYDETWTLAQTVRPELQGKLAAGLSRKENALLIQIRMGILFPLFFAIAIVARRRDAGLHKRMIMLSTVVVLPPAIDRIPWLPTSLPQSFATSEIYMLLAIAPMFIWDTLRNRAVHRAYWVWFGVSLPFGVALYCLWDTPIWHRTAHQFLAG